MAPFGVSCLHQLVINETAVQKSRFRWDYKRSAWRHIAKDGRVLNYWIRNCPVCRREDDHMTMHRQRCTACSIDQYHRLAAISGPAHRKVLKAVRDGLLPKLDGSVACVDCGQKARRYDHREYARPLEVDPVCCSCNGKRGPALETAPLIVKLRN